MIDLKELRQAAENATPGPWRAFSDEICIATEQEVGLRYPTIASNIDSRKKWFNYADSQFIALANPQTIIALCDMIEKMKICENCKNLAFDENDYSICKLADGNTENCNWELA